MTTNQAFIPRKHQAQQLGAKYNVQRNPVQGTVLYQYISAFTTETNFLSASPGSDSSGSPPGEASDSAQMR